MSFVFHNKMVYFCIRSHKLLPKKMQFWKIDLPSIISPTEIHKFCHSEWLFFGGNWNNCPEEKLVCIPNVRMRTINVHITQLHNKYPWVYTFEAVSVYYCLTLFSITNKQLIKQYEVLLQTISFSLFCQKYFVLMFFVVCNLVWAYQFCFPIVFVCTAILEIPLSLLRFTENNVTTEQI